MRQKNFCLIFMIINVFNKSIFYLLIIFLPFCIRIPFVSLFTRWPARLYIGAFAVFMLIKNLS
mgnify:CR=1 FL=1